MAARQSRPLASPKKNRLIATRERVIMKIDIHMRGDSVATESHSVDDLGGLSGLRHQPHAVEAGGEVGAGEEVGSLIQMSLYIVQESRETV